MASTILDFSEALSGHQHSLAPSNHGQVASGTVQDSQFGFVLAGSQPYD